MNRLIRIGLIAEGKAELGLTVPYIKSEDGGKIIDMNDQPISDRTAGGLAMINFETWLLADTHTVANILDVEITSIDNLETLESTKDILDAAINKSSYFLENSNNQRPLQIRWNLPEKIDLAMIKLACPHGYANFTNSLLLAAKSVIPIINT